MLLSGRAENHSEIWVWGVVGAGGGKARTELREEREVEAELLDEPINGRAASLRENLRDSGRVSVSDGREARGSEVKYLATRARSGFVRKKEAAFRGAPPGISHLCGGWCARGRRCGRLRRHP